MEEFLDREINLFQNSSRKRVGKIILEKRGIDGEQSESGGVKPYDF